LVLAVAAKYNIPVRIAHSHAKATADRYRWIREFLRRSVSRYSTLNLACSMQAGIWLFGNDEFKVFKNSVDTRRFGYINDRQLISKIKSAIGISEGDYVVGSVGRFCEVKNYHFLIDVFYSFLKRNGAAKLVLVGDGELKQSLIEKVRDLGIIDRVKFIGRVKNPEVYLNVFDIFALTSLSEGLPLVFIEAQCNGLPVLMSDGVPPEVNLTDLTHVKSIKDSPIEWAECLEEISKKGFRFPRESYYEIVKYEGYDIKENAQALTNLYYSELAKYT